MAEKRSKGEVVQGPDLEERSARGPPDSRHTVLAQPKQRCSLVVLPQHFRSTQDAGSDSQRLHLRRHDCLQLPL